MDHGPSKSWFSKLETLKYVDNNIWGHKSLLFENAKVYDILEFKFKGLKTTESDGTEKPP